MSEFEGTKLYNDVYISMRGWGHGKGGGYENIHPDTPPNIPLNPLRLERGAGTVSET